jgi:hypothetical protein
VSGDALASIGVRRQVFDEQVQQILIAQAAEKEGIRLSDRDLDREIDKLVDQQVKQERERAAQGKADDRPAVRDGHPQRDGQERRRVARGAETELGTAQTSSATGSFAAEADGEGGEMCPTRRMKS